MRYAKLIGHQLVRMLPMGLAKILVKHNSMADGQAAVNAIDNQEQQPGHIGLGQDQLADAEQQDEGCD